jgi:hypothetical protein
LRMKWNSPMMMRAILNWLLGSSESYFECSWFSLVLMMKKCNPAASNRLSAKPLISETEGTMGYTHL